VESGNLRRAWHAPRLSSYPLIQRLKLTVRQVDNKEFISVAATDCDVVRASIAREHEI
jgi:hypothetical protein